MSSGYLLWLLTQTVFIVGNIISNSAGKIIFHSPSDVPFVGTKLKCKFFQITGTSSLDEELLSQFTIWALASAKCREYFLSRHWLCSTANSLAAASRVCLNWSTVEAITSRCRMSISANKVANVLAVSSAVLVPFWISWISLVSFLSLFLGSHYH